jgi:hypothetical protein
LQPTCVRSMPADGLSKTPSTRHCVPVLHEATLILPGVAYT